MDTLNTLTSFFPLILAKKSRPAKPDEEKGFATAILFIVIVLVVAALVMMLFGSYEFPL